MQQRRGAGLIGDGTPADETTPNTLDKVIGTYKRSKYLAEQAVLALARHGVPVVIVNPSAPVGPRDIKPTPTGKMIADTAAGRMPAYVDTGLNVVHVDDVARGHVLALERGRVGECYILGGEDMGMAHLLAWWPKRPGASRPASSCRTAPLYPLALASEGAGAAGRDRADRDAGHPGDGAQEDVLLLRQGAGRTGLRAPPGA